MRMTAPLVLSDCRKHFDCCHLIIQSLLILYVRHLGIEFLSLLFHASLGFVKHEAAKEVEVLTNDVSHLISEYAYTKEVYLLYRTDSSSFRGGGRANARVLQALFGTNPSFPSLPTRHTSTGEL